MGETIFTRTFSAERGADGLVTLSTETPCPQDGLILLAGGWDLSRFEKVSPKMFYNHSTYGSDDFPVGRWDDMGIVNRKLMGSPVFAAKEHPERAGIVKKLWDGGFLDDVSVSFRIDPTALGDPQKAEDGRVYQVSGRHELMECSIVGIGADQNSGKGRGRMDEALSRGVITPQEIDALALRVDEVVELNREITELRAALEAVTGERDRLAARLEALTPRVLKVTVAHENEGERVQVSPAMIRQMVEERVAARIEAAAVEKVRVLRGRLP